MADVSLIYQAKGFIFDFSTKNGLMKQHLSLLFIFILLITTTSCLNPEDVNSVLLDDMEMNQFKDVDFSELQKSIDNRSDIKNGMEALRVYYPNDQGANAGNKFTTKSVKNKFGNNFLLFKQENLNDDSLQAIAFWMEYETSLTGKINVVGLKESYKCQDGRGHQEWSGELCE
jgi:hypothetical protein